MKKLILICSFLMLINCESNDTNQYCDIINNQTINLTNPQFNQLQVPGGWNYANGSTKGIVLYNYINNFRAFSRECPQLDCASKMTVLNNTKLVCPCDNSEYSILDGSPLTENFTKPVCEFKVIKVSSNVLQVVNY